MNKKLAPVIIPTLNRYEHLLNCIDSLRQNSLASETEIYISVDYPPSAKYEEGYFKIVDYFKKNIIWGFKAVHIYCQEKNLGPFRNPYFLISQIEKNYDYYIFSEDDNIFSKNFLEYMNFYLEKYKNDKSIYCVCGHSIPINWKCSEPSIHKNISILSAYGYGLWFEKERDLHNFTLKELQNCMRDFKKSYSLFRSSKKMFCDAINAARGNHYIMLDENKNLAYIDTTRAIYTKLTHKYVIMPTVSKVRNMGYDGSGVNCAGEKNVSTSSTNIYNYDFSMQPIDEAEHFDGTKYEVNEISRKEYQLINRFFPESSISVIKSIIKWVLFNLKKPTN